MGNPGWKADRSAADLASRWAQPPSTFVATDGMQVHVRDEGPRDAKPPIVLLHGTGNSLHTWDGWAQHLKDEYRIVRLDRPGFGLTGPNPSGDYSMAYYTGFMRRFLDVMEIDRCVLAGNSAGGLVAWHFAVAEPSRVEKLVLIASSGYPRTIPPALGFRIAMSPLGSIILHLISKSSVANSVRRTYGDPSKVTQEVIDRTYEVMLRAGNRDALGPAIRQARSDDNAALISSIAAPTLILWGTLDTVVPPSDADRFKADIRGSELVMFPGVGHLPQEEAPDATVGAFREFLRA
jgi:pimeloyl-ACP methyl ester carboxylesterase